eukprot:6898925-Pyramimonas_sp.AAC.1
MVDSAKEQIAEVLPPKARLTLLTKPAKSPSINSSMVNIKRWARRLPEYDTPCTRSALRVALGGGEGNEGKAHYCIRSSTSTFAQAFPNAFSAESGLIWHRQSISRQCSAPFQHLADRVRTIIRGPFALDMHSFWAIVNNIFVKKKHFRDMGVLEGDMMSRKAK